VIIVTPTPPSPIKGEGYSGMGEDCFKKLRIILNLSLFKKNFLNNIFIITPTHHSPIKGKSYSEKDEDYSQTKETIK
jgi:hypothetical protein